MIHIKAYQLLYTEEKINTKDIPEYMKERVKESNKFIPDGVCTFYTEKGNRFIINTDIL